MNSEDAGGSSKDESIKDIFDQGMKLLDLIENSKEPTNSDITQMNVKKAISNFEKCTNLVSMTSMFSANESLDELPTETLQYLLLPALLGTLTLKICGRQRSDVIQVAEIYFRDFLQRCKDYGIANIEIPKSDDDVKNGDNRILTEQVKISNMIITREAKINRYKAAKELKEKLASLSKAMSHPNLDDETKREYFLTLLQTYVNEALDELSSIEQEKPILEYMQKHGEMKPKDRKPAPALKPVIITRDALQKAVYGMGYPALPAMTIEEFYDNRVKEGLFPGSCTTIPHTTIQNSEEDFDDTEQIQKEQLAEVDDPEHLAQQRDFDEYKDDHRRGWGNRHNRS